MTMKLLILLLFSSHITVNDAQHGCKGELVCLIGKAIDYVEDIVKDIATVTTSVGIVGTQLQSTANAVTDISTEVVTNIPASVTAVKGVVDTIETEVKSLPASIRTEITDIVGQITDATTDIGGKITDIVEDITGPIGGAITTAKSEITGEITNAMNAIEAVSGEVDSVITTTTQIINTALPTATNTITGSITTAKDHIENAIKEGTNTINNWFTAFEDAINSIGNEFNNIGDDIEDKISSLKNNFKNLADTLGKNIDVADEALNVVLKTIIEASSLPNNWMGQFPFIIDIVGDCKDILDNLNIESLMGSQIQRRRRGRRILEETSVAVPPPILEFNGNSIDNQQMIWHNTGGLTDNKYNIDLNQHNLVSVNNIQCNSICFNGEIQKNLPEGQCVKLDIDIREDNYQSLTIDLYLYQRSRENSRGQVLSAGDKNERSIYMYSSYFNPPEERYGIGIGNGYSWEGHKILDNEIWTHIVAVWDGVNNVATLYVNDDDPIIDSRMSLDNDNDNTYMCLNTNPDDTRSYWDGCVRSIRIYDYALSSEQIELIKDDNNLIDCAPYPIPILEFKGDSIDDEQMIWYNTGTLSDGYNIDLNQYIANNLVSVNDVQCNSVCFNVETQKNLPEGQCVKLDIDIREDNYQSLTIDLYLYQRTKANNDGTIVSSGGRAIKARTIYMHSPYFKPEGEGYGIGIGNGYDWEGHKMLDNAIWSHIVAVWDGRNQVATLYVNNDDPVISDRMYLDRENNNAYICLNTDPDDTKDDSWDGCMRSIRIYDYALSPKQVELIKDDNNLIDCTNKPTLSPSDVPTDTPTKQPSSSPSDQPTDNPTKAPTMSPTTTAERCINGIIGDSMCIGSELGYTTGSNYAGYVKNLLQPKHIISSDGLISNSIGYESARAIYTNGNVYVRLHTALTVLKIVRNYCDIGLELILDSLSIKEPLIPINVAVKLVIALLDTAIWILEMFTDAADIHDGLLMTTHMAKLAIDTDIIINNQYFLHNQLKESGILNAQPISDNKPMQDNNIDNKQNYNDNYDDKYYHIPKEFAHLGLIIITTLLIIVVLSIISNMIMVYKLNAKNNSYSKIEVFNDTDIS